MVSTFRKRESRRGKALKALSSHYTMAFLRLQAKKKLVFTVLLSLLAQSTCMHSTTRNEWVRERSTFWWEQIVNVTFTPRDWISNFRMSLQTFLYICNQLRSHIQRKATVMRTPISVEQRVAVTLWYLATGTDYRTISHLFGISKSSGCLIVKEVCSEIVSVLLPIHIKLPKGDKLTEVLDGFEHKWGFPQCVGAVDGMHIPIIAPMDCPADYYNRKSYHSIQMQGAVDHLYRFTNIYLGWPGRVHDSRVFVNSTLFQKANEGTPYPSKPKIFGGINVPLVMLGDPA